MLAKRTHPDLGTENEAAFVALQSAYNEALSELVRRHEEGLRANPAKPPGGLFTDTASGTAAGAEEVWFPTTPRERVLHFLYRYKAMLPSVKLESSDIPPACHRAFGNALDAAAHYSDECRYTLQQFDEQLHSNRSTLLRFPEVTSKYRFVVLGLAAFFDYCTIANAINRRLTLSYLREIRPVTDFDPQAPPEVRSNRSAPARSAMYRMRVWLESELERGPCRLL